MFCRTPSRYRVISIPTWSFFGAGGNSLMLSLQLVAVGRPVYKKQLFRSAHSISMLAAMLTLTSCEVLLLQSNRASHHFCLETQGIDE